nr:MAG TPA: hypothetical protein [Caudoviricetes sp.]
MALLLLITLEQQQLLHHLTILQLRTILVILMHFL